jgi:hypothetical protein
MAMGFRSISMLMGLLMLAGCAHRAEPSATSLNTVGAGQPDALWQVVALPGKRATQYRWIDQGSDRVIEATSDRSASMLRRTINVDTCDSPKMRFSWQVQHLIAGADLTRSEGEDAPVRVILAFDGDHSRLSFRNQALFETAELLTGERPPYATLMYVWDNQAELNSVIVNPRTDRIRDVVLESGPARLGHWLSYERDIIADYKLAFGEEPGRLIGMAVMTDSDNTSSKVQARYRNIELVADGRVFR